MSRIVIVMLQMGQKRAWTKPSISTSTTAETTVLRSPERKTERE
jgi:hypothetical protein